MQAGPLNSLTDLYPECLIAAYADISTKVALMVADGPISVPMEALNELCAEAALTLGEPSMPNLGAEPCNLAVKLVEHAVFVYVRAPGEPSEAYLFMCRPSVDLHGFLESAQAKIAEAG